MYFLKLTLALALIGLMVPAAAQDDAKQKQVKVVEELLDMSKNYEVRHLGYGVSVAMDAGLDMALVDKLIRRTLSYQIMDPNSREYGYFTWRTEETTVKDANSLEFTMIHIGAAVLKYWDRLPDGLKKDIMPHLRAALVALSHRNMGPDYTNIFLMNAVSAILLGEAIGDKESVKFGSGELDKWVRFTRGSGITEYVTPNYYAVCLRLLYIGYDRTRLPEVRDKLRVIMDYFWADICANYFPANATISGAYSRTYDFLNAQMVTDGFVRDEGLVSKDPAERQKLRSDAVTKPGYHPNDKIYSLAFVPEKVVIQRTESSPRGRRYNYITPGFSISSSSRDHENIDRPIAIEFASPKNLPVITVQPEPFDEPYGLKPIPIYPGSYHTRAYHFFLHPTTVQEKGALLALVDLDGDQINKQLGAPLGCVATDVVLPAKADVIMLDTKRFDSTAPFRQIAGDRSVVGVREGNAGVAIRIFMADTCQKQRPVYMLQADERGLGVGALRYTVYSYRGPERKLEESHIRIGLLFLAEKCNTDEDLQRLMEKARSASFADKTTDNLWEVSARVGNLSLEAGHNLQKRIPAYRRVNGQEMPNPRLSVNGIDLANSLLGNSKPTAQEK